LINNQKILVLIEKVSDPYYFEEKTFNNLEELMKWMKETYDSWIIAFDWEDIRTHKKYFANLIIYDEYVE